MKTEKLGNNALAGRTLISFSESLSIKHQINKILQSQFRGTRYALVMESKLTAMLLKHQLKAVVCVGIYRGKAEARIGMHRKPPAVLVVSSQLLDGTAAEVLRELKTHQPLARSLIFVGDGELHGDYEEFNGVVAERDLGSMGRPAIRALVATLNNGRYCSVSVIRAQEELKRQQRKEDLTAREQDILNLLVKRMSNQEIADELGLSPETVKTYSKTVLAKLGARSRQELVSQKRNR